jgi:hypothetical protein
MELYDANRVHSVDAARGYATAADTNRPAEGWSGMLRDGRVFIMQILAGVEGQWPAIVVRWAGQPVSNAVTVGTFLRLDDARAVLRFLQTRWVETHRNQEAADRVAWLAP